VRVASGPGGYLVLSIDQDLPSLEWLQFVEGDPAGPGDEIVVPSLLGVFGLTTSIPATMLGDSFEILFFSGSPETWLQTNFVAGNGTCPAGLETTFGISFLPERSIEMNGATGMVYGYDSSFWAAVLSAYDFFFPECGFTIADLSLYSFHLFPWSTVDVMDSMGSGAVPRPTASCGSRRCFKMLALPYREWLLVTAAALSMIRRTRQREIGWSLTAEPWR
jgi:hypothetical protein